MHPGYATGDDVFDARDGVDRMNRDSRSSAKRFGALGTNHHAPRPYSPKRRSHEATVAASKRDDARSAVPIVRYATSFRDGGNRGIEDVVAEQARRRMVSAQPLEEFENLGLLDVVERHAEAFAARPELPKTDQRGNLGEHANLFEQLKQRTCHRLGPPKDFTPHPPDPGKSSVVRG